MGRASGQVIDLTGTPRNWRVRVSCFAQVKAQPWLVLRVVVGFSGDVEASRRWCEGLPALEWLFGVGSILGPRVPNGHTLVLCCGSMLSLARVELPLTIVVEWQ